MSRFSGLIPTMMAVLTAGAIVPRADGEDSTVERFVEFRDGTRLRLLLPRRTIELQTEKSVGGPTLVRVELATLGLLQLAETPPNNQLAQVRKAVADLAAETFEVRHVAQRRLMAISSGFRDVLEEERKVAVDSEVRWRLDAVLAKLPGDDAVDNSRFDAVTLADGRLLRGDIGPWQEMVAYRGHMLMLERSNVRKISREISKTEHQPRFSGAATQRIAADQDALFSGRITRVDFERDPSGKPLKSGDDIRRRFVRLGFSMETSIEGAIVSVTSYNVQGRSGGQSAATHQPLYQGILTIRFCQPGNAQIQAGVHQVGFWAAHVRPDGTKLEAYDARDRLLDEVAVTKSPRDFLALRSRVPIAKIRVVPNPAIDGDYAIDDLTFDRPRPREDVGEPDFVTVHTRTGERLVAENFSVDGQRLTLERLNIGPEGIELPLAEVATLLTAINRWDSENRSGEFWALLGDSSVVRGMSNLGLRLDRDQQIDLATEQLVALWGSDAAYQEPPESLRPSPGKAVLLHGAMPKTIEAYEFGDRWIEAKDFRPAKEFTYANSPALWFAPRPERSPNAGLLRTTGGEEFVLGTAGRFELRSISRDAAMLSASGREIRIPMTEIISIRWPQK